jgi:hypothetical protein
MAITKLHNMTLVAQISDAGCWCASAQMLYKWGRKSGQHRMTDPLADPGIKWRWTESKDWDSSDNGWLATTLNVEIQSEIPLDYKGLKSFLKDHGPIWTAGMKTWTGDAYGHVVVICDVADTGVFIYDPEPVNKGSSRWLTWTQICDYINGTTPTVQFLTVM